MPLHKAGPRNSNKAYRLRIVDPGALANVVKSLVARHGTQAATAKATGIEQSQLSRLAGERLQEMGLRQFESLAKHLSAEERARLAPAFFSRKAQIALRTYEKWVTRTIRRLDGRGGSDDGRLGRQRRVTAKTLHREIMAKFPWLYNRLLREANANKVERDRFGLALLRVLEPLLEDARSGFVERNWQELSDDELREFVEAGITREVILFARSSDFLRAQHSGTTR
jgi:uncharacterized protein YheU (UPF0270 family)